MIFIAVKFTIQSAQSDEFMSRIEPFTTATRSEPGNIFFEWSKSTEVPDQFVLLEAFESAEAGDAHVNSQHFKAAMEWFPNVFSEGPQIIHVEAPGAGWGQMAELETG